jgi:formylglycine-generating enzyme
MRAILVGVALATLCAWQAGCSSTPISSGSEYAATREQQFASWKKREVEGTNAGPVIWECAVCPRVFARPPGEIWAGSPPEDPDRQPNEPLETSVAIPDAFAVGLFEVTRGEFQEFVTATHRKPSRGCSTDRRTPGRWEMDRGADFRDPGFTQNDDHPVVCVSWQDARDYVAWLNTRTSGGYRLPTEAEWHFAGYGGAHAIYTWGDSPEPACGYANALDASGVSMHPRAGSVSCNDGAIATAPVGRYRPGSGFMFDTFGNAAEWTSTCDPIGANTGTSCVRAIVKGGSWKSTGVELRLAARNALPVGNHDNSVGFRVAKSLGDPAAVLPDSAAYLERGRRAIFQLDFPRAQADLERAVELAPDDSHALSARGWGNFRNQKMSAAAEDFNAALTLDASNAEAIAGLGAVALMRKNSQEAVALIDRALAIEPDYEMALAIRAGAHMQRGEWDLALADAASGLKLVPLDIELLRLRVHARAQQRDWARTLAEVDELSRVFPTLTNAQTFAADLYSLLLMDDDAVRAATRAFNSAHIVENLLLRAEVRPWTDIAGRRADIEMAFGKEPGSLQALQALGELESRVGNHDAAMRAFTKLLEQDEDGRYRTAALTRRGIESLKHGDTAAGMRDLEAALGEAPDAWAYNDLCWDMSVANVALPRALEYCSRALAARPDAASILDSKGAVLLRLGKWDEAMKVYDKAISLQPTLASSLYGRGIAAQSRCRCQDGIADLREALRLKPNAGRTYERAGIVAPFPPAGDPIRRIAPPSGSAGSALVPQ